MAPDTSDPAINTTHQTPVRPTAVDGQGIERIVGPPVDDWQPAQVDPTDEQVRRMDEHNAREAARREERTSVLADREAAVDAEPETEEVPEPETPVEPETPAEPETTPGPTPPPEEIPGNSGSSPWSGA